MFEQYLQFILKTDTIFQNFNIDKILMSKSNLEKQRVAKRIAFEKGEIPFDFSMLKIKLSFYSVSDKSRLYMKTFDGSKKSKKIRNNNIKNKRLKNFSLHKEPFKELIKDEITNVSKKLLIYDFDIKIHLYSIYLRGLNNEIDIYYGWKITVYHYGLYVGEINANNEYQEPHSIFCEKTLLLNIKNEHLVLRNSFYWNDRKTNILLSKTCSNILLVKNLNSFLNYVIKYKSLFKILLVSLSYCYSNNEFEDIVAYCSDKSGGSRNNFMIGESNLDFLNILHKMNVITFDIKDLSEEEILAMYNLISY